MVVFGIWKNYKNFEDLINKLEKYDDLYRCYNLLGAVFKQMQE